MAENRKTYEVEIGGLPHTLLLNEEDVDRHKKAGRELKEVKAPANKSGTPSANKG